AWMRKQLEEAHPDLLREMVGGFAQALMGAEAQALCGADYGEHSSERINSRNGYRQRDWDTRAGTISLAIPKLRQGSYYPEWLLEPRRRAERAMVAVVAEAYLAGVSTRRVESVVQAMGIERIFEVAGLGAGQEPRRSRRRLPQPAAGRGPVHIPMGGRAHPALS